MKKIDILTTDGSPLGVTSKSIWGLDGRLGVGGAELALLTLCEGWTKKGHRVRLYNNPKEYGASTFDQLNVSNFDPKENRDVLIIFRSPNHIVENAKGMKVWFSTDQNTVGDFKKFSKSVDKIVTISQRHSQYFTEIYGIKDTTVIDLPIRTADYEGKKIEKITNRCVFTSIPDRGLTQMHSIWSLIVKEIPDASLVITSDWRLWDSTLPEHIIRDYRLKFAGQMNVTYLGAVNRERLIEEQLKAEFHTYPCTYDELFCISIAESQVAGAYPVSSDFGSLPTTNMGTLIKGNPYHPRWVQVFAETVVNMMKDKAHKQKFMDKVKKEAIERFSLEKVLPQWEDVFAGG